DTFVKLDLIFQAEDGIRGFHVTGVQTCALPILAEEGWPGVLLLLAAVFLFSLSGVLVKRVGADVHPLPHTVGTLLFSLPLFGLSWLVADGHWPVLDFGSHSPWAILYLATFGSLVGFVCYFYVLKRLSATTVALVTLITPVFALMLGNLLNG